MKRSTIAILGLSVLLVASNVFWVYAFIDASVTYTYLQNSFENARGTALQALALLPEVARSSATRESAIEAARRVQPDSEPFEKEGFVWVGDIGLRFDSAGTLVEARAAVEPF